jgi:hypothetical protein
MTSLGLGQGAGWRLARAPAMGEMCPHPQMGIALGVKRFVGVAHCLRPAAPEHDLENDGFPMSLM